MQATLFFKTENTLSGHASGMPLQKAFKNQG